MVTILGEASTHFPRLIVGLGNPGRRYESSRHNVGFRVVEHLASLHKAGFSVHRRIPSLVAEWKANEIRWIALKPMTFMNLSGQAVTAALNFWKLPLESLLVVLDDTELKPGLLRLRGSGGTAGHRGLNSILEQLNTRQVVRLRVGIGRPPGPDDDLAEWVLKPFEKLELPWLEDSIKRAVVVTESWGAEGLEKAMQIGNRGRETEDSL